jgi:hypothetical protein
MADLEDLFNSLLREAPANPIDFLVNSISDGSVQIEDAVSVDDTSFYLVLNIRGFRIRTNHLKGVGYEKLKGVNISSLTCLFDILAAQDISLEDESIVELISTLNLKPSETSRSYGYPIATQSSNPQFLIFQIESSSENSPEISILLKQLSDEEIAAFVEDADRYKLVDTSNTLVSLLDTYRSLKQIHDCVVKGTHPHIDLIKQIHQSVGGCLLLLDYAPSQQVQKEDTDILKDSSSNQKLLHEMTLLTPHVNKLYNKFLVSDACIDANLLLSSENLLNLLNDELYTLTSYVNHEFKSNTELIKLWFIN